MSDFYKPHRNPHWNYGGKNWRLSRSKIDLFVECPRCFYIDNKLGTARPRGFPFNLNSAVDTLFKKEFDAHRASRTPHPIMKQYGVDAVPFAHDMIDEWRENFKGIAVPYAPTGFTVCGAVDDIWVNTDGELFVVDYKSTSKDEKIEALDQDWHAGYKRQMEVYQWLLRQKGFAVSNKGYFVYANGDTEKEAFNNRLEFETTLIEYEGDDSWVAETLASIKKCLDDPRVPLAGSECEYCAYREATGKALIKNKEERAGATAPARKPSSTPPKNAPLF